MSDYFYQYQPLEYDDGGTIKGFFGYKVLAVGFGGTLQLFGKKGATMLRSTRRTPARAGCGSRRR